MKTLETTKLIENFKSEELEDRLEFGRWSKKEPIYDYPEIELPTLEL